MRCVIRGSSYCQVCEANDVPLKICGRCLTIRYCGYDHQRKHWPEHKLICSELAELYSDNQDLQKKEIIPRVLGLIIPFTSLA